MEEMDQMFEAANLNEKAIEELLNLIELDSLIKQIKNNSFDLHQLFFRLIAYFAFTPRVFVYFFGENLNTGLISQPISNVLEYILDLPIFSYFSKLAGSYSIDHLADLLEQQATTKFFNLKRDFGDGFEALCMNVLLGIYNIGFHPEIKNLTDVLKRAFMDALKHFGKSHLPINEQCKVLDNLIAQPQRLGKAFRLPVKKFKSNDSALNFSTKYHICLITTAILVKFFTHYAVKKGLEYYPLGILPIIKNSSQVKNLLKSRVEKPTLALSKEEIKHLEDYNNTLKNWLKITDALDYGLLAFSLYMLYQAYDAVSPVNWVFFFYTLIYAKFIPNGLLYCSNFYGNYSANINLFSKNLKIITTDFGFQFSKKLNKYDSSQGIFYLTPRKNGLIKIKFNDEYLQFSEKKVRKSLCREMIIAGLDVLSNNKHALVITSRKNLTKNQATEILTKVKSQLKFMHKLKEIHLGVYQNFEKFSQYYHLEHSYKKIFNKKVNFIAYLYQLVVPVEHLIFIKTQLEKFFAVDKIETENAEEFSVLELNISGKKREFYLSHQKNPSSLLKSSNYQSIGHNIKNKHPNKHKKKEDNSTKNNKLNIIKNSKKLPPKIIDFGKNGKFNSKVKENIVPIQSSFISSKKSPKMFAKFTVPASDFLSIEEYNSFASIFSGHAKLAPPKSAKGIVRNDTTPVKNKETGEWIMPPSFKAKDPTKDGRVYVGQIVESKTGETLYVFDTYIPNTH